ncbi:Proto-oncogene Mas-like protein [Aix galericulata]|nr:Proto-oncogene Mas-like protein [Aix galericulata]
MLREIPDAEGDHEKEEEEDGEEDNDVEPPGLAPLGAALDLNEEKYAREDHGWCKDSEVEGVHGDEGQIALVLLIFLSFCIYTNFVFDICLLLAAINSSSNPIIYVLGGNYKKQNFGESVKMALQRVFEDRADPWMLCKGKVNRQIFCNERAVPHHRKRQSCLLELAQWDGA